MEKDPRIVSQGQDLAAMAEGLQVLLDRYPDDPHIVAAFSLSRELVEVLIGLLTPIKH